MIIEISLQRKRFSRSILLAKVKLRLTVMERITRKNKIEFRCMGLKAL